jgi:hypothetical protein
MRLLMNTQWKCKQCNTINNKWSKVYFSPEGSLIYKANNIYISFCAQCDAYVTKSIKTKIEMEDLNDN